MKETFLSLSSSLILMCDMQLMRGQFQFIEIEMKLYGLASGSFNPSNRLTRLILTVNWFDSDSNQIEI